MAANKRITVEVAYAAPKCQRIVSVEIEADSTIEAAIQRSGILTLFPEVDLSRHKVGVFSRSRQLSDGVKDGDRIEIYRPLLIDPKEARRAKARHASKKKR